MRGYDFLVSSAAAQIRGKRDWLFKGLNKRISCVGQLSEKVPTAISDTDHL